MCPILLPLASPTGKKFRSKPQLARYLGNSMDLNSFDFRTGKMLMSKLNKNRQRPRYDNNSQTKVRGLQRMNKLSFDKCYLNKYFHIQKNIFIILDL